MSSERLEWVEIMEPSSRHIMYANLTTGQCVWEPPPHVPVKKFDCDQWWELFDSSTSRFYYYNASTQKTVWHKPQNCDIIPLAKLQQIKQNTEVNLLSQRVAESRPQSAASRATDIQGGAGRAAGWSYTPGSRCPRPWAIHQERIASTASFQKGASTQTSPAPPRRRASEASSSEATSSNTSSSAHSVAAVNSLQKPATPHHHNHHHRHHRSHHHSFSPTPPAASPSAPPPPLDATSTATTSSSSSSGQRHHHSRHHSTSSCPHSHQRRHTPVVQQPTANGSADLARRPRRGSAAQVPPPTKNSIRECGRLSDSAVSVSRSSLEASRCLTPTAARRSRAGYGSAAVEASGVPGHRFSPVSDRPRDFCLSRSYSFMATRPEARFEEGNSDLTRFWPGPGGGAMRSVESTPQARRRARAGYPVSAGAGSGSGSGGRRCHKSPRDSSPSPPSSISPHSQPEVPPSQAQKARSRLVPSPVLSTRSRVPTPSEAKMDKTDKLDKTDKSDTWQRNAPRRSATSSSIPYNGPTDATNGSSAKHMDMTHLYSNLDYIYDQPVYQFIMEQAKLSGQGIQDTFMESGSEDDEEDAGSGRVRSGRRRRPTGHDSDDHFADDEAFSNPDDSSSQEHLEDYLADDETYTQFFMPAAGAPVARSRTHDKLQSNTDVPDHSESRPTAYPETNNKVLNSTVTNNQISNSESAAGVLAYASLRRKKEAAPPPPLVVSAAVINEQNAPRGASPLVPSCPLPQIPSQSSIAKPPSINDFERLSLSNVSNVSGPSTASTVPCSDGNGSNMMEKYAQENLNIHTRGLLRKKVPVIDMISWTKEGIRKPMLLTIDKALKTAACDMFRLVQTYMSDRKPSRSDMTLNSVGLDVVLIAFDKPGLRDELYVQICRQTTENQKRDSLRRGWELLAICLDFFPPSDKFRPYLAGFIAKHCDSEYQSRYPEIAKWPIHIQINHYASVCAKRLERLSAFGGRGRVLRRPTVDDIDLARLHIFRASMFGGSLEEVMALQRDRYPHRRLPWVQTTLSEEVLRLQGASTEGIFRVPADVDDVTQLKQIVDQWEVTGCGDAHVAAATLKLWYRELLTPLIPDDLYEDAVAASENAAAALDIVNRLPEINRIVLAYLIRFLQYFSQSEIVAQTKMDASNLSMVMAPNCLRCTSQDPKVIYENTRKEMAFLHTLILNLDTAFMEGWL